MKIKNVIGLEGRVRLKFSQPIAILVLKGREIRDSFVDRAGELVLSETLR
jgi:hypothetical protein